MSVEEDEDESFHSVSPGTPAETWPETDMYHNAEVVPLREEQTTPSCCAPSHTESDGTQIDIATVTPLASKFAVSTPSSPTLQQSALETPQRHLADCDARDETLTRLLPKRPSTSGGERISTWSDAERVDAAIVEGRKTRSKTVSAQSEQAPARSLDGGNSAAVMYRNEHGKERDLFLELANDHAAMGETIRPASPDEPLQRNRSSFNTNRSLPPADGDSSYEGTRPRSSGEPLSRGQSSDLQRHVGRYSSARPARSAFLADDSTSVSSAARYGVLYRPAPSVAEPSPLQSKQMRSPELPHYGRGRPSFCAPSRPGNDPRAARLSGRLQGPYGRSAAGDSEQKHSADSASADSETADTVWDELDDLKSRIKKLELKGKLPPTSGAAISTEQGDRPRTATTAPTTIDSSPKHTKPEIQDGMGNPEMEPITTQAPQELSGEHVVGGPDAANIHPNLHSALARAKTLLNPSLYRSLQATAADALQLAVMTGSAGPQGTVLTAAAIINGVTVSDRHVRRKADTMCRNLTDLVLALCEGKNDTTSLTTSPVMVKSPIAKRSPTLRYSRDSLDPPACLDRSRPRPMSRLEARRTSILGSQVGSTGEYSALESGEDISASELESTASRPRLPPRTSLGQSKSVSRLQAARLRMYGEGAAEEDDPTVRPPSRAATDFTRPKAYGGKDYSTPRRSPSLRESLAARRISHEGAEGLQSAHPSHSISLASDSGRSRRFLDPNDTPPVVVEEGGRDDGSSYSSRQPRRRVPSSGSYVSRRSTAELPGRTPSLLQRRQVLVE